MTRALAWPWKIPLLGIIGLTILFFTLTGCGSPDLTLEMTSPEDGAEVTESLLTVEGTVSDPEATVTVNGEEVEVAEDGSFSAEVELTSGENTIEVKAELDGAETSKSITVTYSPAE